MIKIDGEKIRQLRERQGLTQLYMATVVEVTTDTISRWENKRYPTIKEENGEKLAEALGVSLEDILLIETAPPDTTGEQNDLKSSAKVKNYRSRKTLTWVFGFVFLLLLGATAVYMYMKQATLYAIAAERIMPLSTLPNSPFPVVIEIRHSGTDPVSIIVKDTLPEGSEILEVSPVEGSSVQKNEVKWIRKLTETTRFSYLVKISGDAEKHFFSGEISTSKREETFKISGIQSIDAGLFHWADSNSDNSISDQEILTVFDYYSGIDDFTVDIEFIEKMWLGSSYSWDRDNQQILISP
ncbi:MAG: helix-turn-helix domain-containing protein [Desulfopila sp.]|jgi:transcriptional regulator with XRE-family HTH domain|nr:helix-turn-helix domain-containing protein [Desulfopila sp.]